MKQKDLTQLKTTLAALVLFCQGTLQGLPAMKVGTVIGHLRRSPGSQVPRRRQIRCRNPGARWGESHPVGQNPGFRMSLILSTSCAEDSAIQRWPPCLLSSMNGERAGCSLPVALLPPVMHGESVSLFRRGISPSPTLQPTLDGRCPISALIFVFGA